MGLSKSFQLVLFVIFGLLLYRIYDLENKEMQLQGSLAIQNYSQHLNQMTEWNEDGEALYKELSKTFTFKFFQYIHSNDSELNYTFGSLAKSDDEFEDKIFKIELSDTKSFPDGRLQVRLSTQSVISTSFVNLEKAATLTIFAYLIIMISFAVLMAIHRRGIKYACDYIEQVPNLSFQAVETSRLRGSLKPIGLALEKSRMELKTSIDNFHKENNLLAKAANQDPVTGFSTRRRFNEHIKKISQSDKQQFGVLAIIKAAELSSINQLQGREAGDEYLSQIAACIRRAAAKFGVNEYYRVSSSDFALFIQDITVKEAEKFLILLKGYLDEYAQTIEPDSIAHSGMVPFESNSDTHALLTLADTAVSIAQTSGPNRYHILEKFSGNEQLGDDHWKVTINELINRKGLKFFQQPILPCNNHVDVYRELYARFFNTEGSNLPTASVIAMSERHGLNVDLDKMIVVHTLQLLNANPSLTGNFGVNISASSALQEVFVSWLRDILSSHRTTSARLIFEVNESGMQKNVTASRRFVHEMHKVGAKVAIQQFGLGFSSFKFFREVKPDVIKLDSSYSEGIDQDNNNKFFVRMIVDISRRIGIKVIATGVERQDEKLTLEKMLVDGLQGYYIARPEIIAKTDK
ncbi:EAL domain-containing protein [Shewanella sp. KT0246]|uniref:EAL domain-containing protein n=1 Tax=Shewanella sp. KT0246 TaxID=2815912 RepID=UPI001BBF6494|nr:GGDEF domain-containing protein [Shewanella sp. KT0246]GIU52840.1 diguanylate cyclase [Shewanella sp. KT0246]